MKANELRIGNWYCYRNSDDERQINVFNLHDMIGRPQAGTDLLYRPIELTTDWLIRFGFIFYQDEPIWQNDPLDIEFDINGFFERDYGVRISYVHQLQNLYFALTGTELELKSAVGEKV